MKKILLLLFTFCLFLSTAFADPAIVQKVPNASTPLEGTNTITFSTMPTSGNLILVVVTENPSQGVTAVTDSEGGSYAQAVRAVTAGGNGVVSMYYRVLTTTPATFVITVNGSSGGKDLGAFEISGVHPTQPINAYKTVSAAGNSGSAAPGSLTAGVNTLFIAAMTGNNASFATLTPPAGWTNDWHEPSYNTAVMDVAHLAGTGTQAPVWTNTSQEWVAAMVAIIPPGNAPTVSTTSAHPTGLGNAVAAGNVTSDQGSTILERGVVYSINDNPPVYGNTATTSAKTSGTTGSYTVSLTNLAATTADYLYRVRAYAINDFGTGYGDTLTLINRKGVTGEGYKIYLRSASGADDNMGSFDAGRTLGAGINQIPGTLENKTVLFTALTNPTSPATLNHTCSGDNRLLIAAVSLQDAANTRQFTLSGVTYNSVSMTKINEAWANNGNTGYASLWALKNPTEGANDISVAFTRSSPPANLTTNGTFAADSNWTKGTGWTISAGVATHAAGTASDLSQTISTIQGQKYTVVFDLTVTAGTITLLVGGTSGYAISSAGTSLTQTITSGSGGTIVFSASADFAGTIDNVTVTGIDQLRISAVSFQGVNQTTPYSNATSAYGSSTTPGLTVTSAAGKIVLDAIVYNGLNYNWEPGGVSTGTNYQTTKDIVYGNEFSAGSSYAGASSVSMGYTGGTSMPWAMLGISVNTEYFPFNPSRTYYSAARTYGYGNGVRYESAPSNEVSFTGVTSRVNFAWDPPAGLPFHNPMFFGF